MNGLNEWAHKSLVAVIERDETRIWLTNAKVGTKPHRIKLPEDRGRHHHMRQATHHRGHDTDQYAPMYYESIAQTIQDADEVLIVGHGNGKANSAHEFIRFLESTHPAIADKIVGVQDVNMQALTEPQLLRLVQEWTNQPINRRMW